MVNRTQLFRALPPSVRRRAPAVRHRLALPSALRRGPWCLAPSVQMHLLPDGDIRACCRNPVPLGNIAEQRLPEIWWGERRAGMQLQLAAKEIPTGCENCAAEIATEGRRGSYPEVFDFWTNRLGRDRTGRPWPIRMEFNLSNRCNLQCIQCSGDLSSSIRIHREGRQALGTVYDDTFFEDLRPFLPHLRHANFAGGEPFLGPENFRVWEMIAEVAPKLECTINTNATQWNRRVEEVLDRGRFSFIFSLDGITKETYESIRIDGDLDEVLANIERFRDHAQRHNTDVNINHCLMPQNHHEFADLLLYAEQRGIKVNVSVVRAPRHCSIAYLPRDDIRSIHRTLTEREHDLLPRLHLNASTWIAEVRRIGTWAEHGPPPDPDAPPGPQPVQLRPRSSLPVAETLPTLPTLETLPTVPTLPTLPTLDSSPKPETTSPLTGQSGTGSRDLATGPTRSDPTILGLPLMGDGPTDDAEARGDLGAFSPDGVVHTVEVEQDETVRSCSAGLLELLGVQPDDIDGHPVSTLGTLSERRFGEVRTYDTSPAGLDRVDAHAVFDEVEGRSATVAVRDQNGRADHARILIAFRPR